ncbi:MAG: hypothetical protein HY072_08050 [Deltaproteobacteria bacterium]|nr:hypothetical protein [Deltaproteobacteria bacterium]
MKLFCHIIFILLLFQPLALSEDFVVYNVQKALSFGNDEVLEKDYFINMGHQNGLRVGSILDVYRKISSYDVRTEKLYLNVTFPFARLKVIHVENQLAIARLEKFLPPEKTPVFFPPGVMAGDIVKKAE